MQWGGGTALPLSSDISYPERSPSPQHHPSTTLLGLAGPRQRTRACRQRGSKTFSCASQHQRSTIMNETLDTMGKRKRAKSGSAYPLQTSDSAEQVLRRKKKQSDHSLERRLGEWPMNFGRNRVHKMPILPTLEMKEKRQRGQGAGGRWADIRRGVAT